MPFFAGKNKGQPGQIFKGENLIADCYHIFMACCRRRRRRHDLPVVLV